MASSLARLIMAQLYLEYSAESTEYSMLQCGLLGIGRSTAYYKPAGESATNLALSFRRNARARRCSGHRDADGDLLQSDKLKLFDRAALHLQAELGCFTDTFHEFVERLGLGMAAWGCWCVVS